jgi:isopenicillin-N epimerase
MRDLFLLDPGVVYLNHGSFGACPRLVFEEYQRLQRELECQPVEFLGRDRRYPALVDAAKARLGAYLGASPENLVFVPNATTAMNAVARGLELREGDEVLAPVGEYGAVDILWRYVCERSGARYVTCPMPPGAAPEEALELLWARVTGATRAVSVSHVSCFTGVVFPVEELCRRAREREILSVVDGAHAPGQIPLELESLGADFYAGDCHKWLCAPKGSGFLHVGPDRQASAAPVLVSWDWAEEDGFADRQRWQGTRDPAAWFAVPAAIDFQAEHEWDAVRERCHGLALEARERLGSLTPDTFVQMVAVPVSGEPFEVQRRLWEEHRIEVVGQELGGVSLLRISFQGYNDEGDLEALVRGLNTVF